MAVIDLIGGQARSQIGGEAVLAQRADHGRLCAQTRGGHVFHDPRTDAPYATDKQFREWQWRRAMLRAGVRYREPRQLRHTYATWLIGAGENIKWVSRQMGHESTQMTLDTYAKWIPDMNPDAGSRAEALWSNNRTDAQNEESNS